MNSEVMKEAVREVASCIRIPTSYAATNSSSPSFTSPDGGDEKCVFCGAPIRAKPLEGGGFTSVCECIDAGKSDLHEVYSSLCSILKEKDEIEKKIAAIVPLIAVAATEKYRDEYEIYVPKRDLVIKTYDAAVLELDVEATSIETYEKLFNGGNLRGRT